MEGYTNERKIYEFVQKNKTVFIEFSRPFPLIDRVMIFPQIINYKENETFTFYPQYVNEHIQHILDRDNYPQLNWRSINLDFDIPDKVFRSFWIFKI